MYGRTAAFDTAIQQGHVVHVVADVLENGRAVLSGLPVLGGGVDVDSSADVRRRCKVDVVDPTGTLTPNDPSDLLSPYGRELRLRRGVLFSDGTSETLTIGTFRISSVDVGHSSTSRKITVTGFDRARSIGRARLETPYTIEAGTNYVTAIHRLLSSRMPGLVLRSGTTTRTTPLIVLEQMADPWKAASDMAESLGCELFFDPDGACVLQRITEGAAPGNAVWEYRAGNGATVLSVDNTFDDDPGYNGAVVDGEPPDAPPVHAVVYDDDPASPTYAGGSYGKVPIFLRSIFVVTQQQAQDAALGLMLKKRGGSEQVKFTAIPHPAHEAGDLVHVVDGDIGLDGYYVIESFSIPLDLGAMSVTCRKRQAVKT